MSCREALEHEWIKQLDRGVSTQDVILAQQAKREILSDVETSVLQKQDTISEIQNEDTEQFFDTISQSYIEEKSEYAPADICKKQVDDLSLDITDKTMEIKQGTAPLMIESNVINLGMDQFENDDCDLKDSVNEEKMSYIDNGICTAIENSGKYIHEECRTDGVENVESANVRLDENSRGKDKESKKLVTNANDIQTKTDLDNPSNLHDEFESHFRKSQENTSSSENNIEKGTEKANLEEISVNESSLVKRLYLQDSAHSKFEKMDNVDCTSTTFETMFHKVEKSNLAEEKEECHGNICKNKIPISFQKDRKKEIKKTSSTFKVKPGTIATQMAKFDQSIEEKTTSKMLPISRYGSKSERKDTLQNKELALETFVMKKEKQQIDSKEGRSLSSDVPGISNIEVKALSSTVSELSHQLTSASSEYQSEAKEIFSTEKDDLTAIDLQIDRNFEQSSSTKSCLSGKKEKDNQKKTKSPLKPLDIPLKTNKPKLKEDLNNFSTHDINCLQSSETKVKPVEEFNNQCKPVIPTTKCESGLKFSLNIGANCSVGKKLNIGPLISVGTKNCTKEFSQMHGMDELYESKITSIKSVNFCENDVEKKNEPMKDVCNRNESGLRRRNEEGSNRKTYRRLYVTKVRNSKVYEHDFDNRNEAAKIVQRVDKDVLQVEVKLKSTDLRLLPLKQ